MKSMVDLSHEFLLPCLHQGAICVDATLGHGKDAKFFLDHKVLKVIGFEVQEDVLNETVNNLQTKKLQAHLLGHEKMDEVIHSQIDCVVFNFGYCPGKDESIYTKTDTSLIAIQKALCLLKKKGRMALVLYPHEAGRQEAKAIEEYVSTLNFNEYAVLKMKLMNQEDSPYLIGIEKNVITISK